MRFALLCLLAACGGGTGGDSCRAQSDCASGFGCVGPDDGPVCGIAPEHGCVTDQDCASGERCHAVYDACSASGVGSMCDAPCTASSCGSGFQCNADGACEPIPCSQGTCPSFQTCGLPITAGPVYSHTDGCADVACTRDAECGGSEACVNGFCQSSIGSCEKVIAVP